jgi:hypothetical protein
MRSMRFLQAALGSLLLVSCADSGQVMAPPETLNPALDAGGKGPPASGPNVIRGPTLPGVLFDEELAVAVGFEEPFADHCADLESPGQPGSTQLVFTPSGGVHGKQGAHEVNLIVYDLNEPFGNPCDLVAAPVLASGTGSFTLTTTDLAFGGSAPGADQVRVTIHGVLDLTTGGQARLLASTHVLLKPDGSFAFDHTRIRLTPL